MGIRAILSAEQFEEQPDDIKALYKKSGDKHVLDVEGIDDHPKVVNLKTAHKKTKDGLKTLKDAVHGREVDEDEISDDAVRDAVVKLRSRFDFLPDDFDKDAFDTMKNAADGKGGQPTQEQLQEISDRVTAKIEKKYSDRHTAEIEPLKATNNNLQNSLNRLVIDGGLSAAMDEADIDGKHKAILLPYLKTRGKITVENDDGALNPVVETDMGNVSLKEWVTEFAGTDEGKQYVAKSEGPGARGGDGKVANGKSMKRSTFDGLPVADRQKTIQDGVQIVD